MTVNTLGTLSVLEAARKAPSVRSIVVVSTAQVYGSSHTQPVAEEAPLEPTTPYAGSKVAAEGIATSYARAYGLPITILRLFNVYGPGQAPIYLVPTIIAQLLEGNVPVVADDRPVRDFTFIADVVDALEAASLRATSSARIYNVGTGTATSTGELTRKLMRIAGIDGEPRVNKPAPDTGSTSMLVADVTRMNRDIGWSARIGLDEGLALTWHSS